MSTADLAICVRCEKRTSWREARQRVFNENACGHCGGQLISLDHYRYDMKEISRLKALYPWLR